MRSREQIVFYGTLMSAFDHLDRLAVREQLRLLGPCRLNGRLFDMGEWPALALGGGIVHGELFEVLDESIFGTLDPFEECYPDDPSTSRYTRERVALLEPTTSAWVYVANEPLTSARPIASGSWHAWIEARACASRHTRG